ncbi:MAG TPA: hypothetical protein VLL77_10595 [Anaerolineales bacterium]|nr:hypothetical protein [Anaerolineales bacterium]
MKWALAILGVGLLAACTGPAAAPPATGLPAADPVRPIVSVFRSPT